MGDLLGESLDFLAVLQGLLTSTAELTTEHSNLLGVILFVNLNVLLSQDLSLQLGDLCEGLLVQLVLEGLELFLVSGPHCESGNLGVSLLIKEKPLETVIVEKMK